MRPRRSSEAARRRNPRRCSEDETSTRPRTNSQEQTKTWSTQNWIIRGKTRRSGRNKATTKCGGSSPDAPDWNIPGRKSGMGRRPPDWGIRGQVAARRPRPAHPGRNKEHRLPPDWIIRGETGAERQGLDHPGWIKQHEPPHPGLNHPGTKGGQTPQIGISGLEQAAAANAAMTQKSRDTWWADAPDWSIWVRTRRSGHNQRGRGKMVCSPGQECPGWTNDASINRCNKTRRPGLDHPERNKQQ